MPSNHRFRARRSSAQKNKKFIKRAHGSRAQSKQLLSLQRQVTTLAKKQEITMQRAQYAVPLDDNGGTDAELFNGLFNCFPMTDPTGTDSSISE